MRVETVDDLRFGIGEGALWDMQAGHFLAVDIMAQQIVRYDPKSREVERFDVGQIIGSLALTKDGKAVVGLASGVHLFDFESGKATLLVDIEPDNRSLLLTEGKADRAGRFLVSSFSTTMKDPVGSLYSVSPDGASEKLRDGIIVPNGLAWSPNGKTLYFADSERFTIYAYDYDLGSGRISGERVFANTEELGGIPDGGTTDDEGNYWVAICKAGVVVCYGSNGVIKTKIELPTKWVASVTFGGERLDQLFITSLDPSLMNLGYDPNGGKLFKVSGLGVTGLAADRFGG